MVSTARKVTTEREGTKQICYSFVPMSSVSEKCQNGNTEMKTSSVFEKEELRVGIVAAVGVRGYEKGKVHGEI
jgi:hypothetical protein